MIVKHLLREVFYGSHLIQLSQQLFKDIYYFHFSNLEADLQRLT